MLCCRDGAHRNCKFTAEDFTRRTTQQLSAVEYMVFLVVDLAVPVVLFVIMRRKLT